MARLKPSTIPGWPIPFDSRFELDWGRPSYARRLLLEHLDQAHDGASRRTGIVARQLRRLRRLLPEPPATILDAGCGPGLYAVPLAQAGYHVTGIDVNRAALTHARRVARGQSLAGSLRLQTADLRTPLPEQRFDAVLLIYYMLEAFPRKEQSAVLRNLARSLRPGGRVVVEMRLQPDQPPGRMEWWDVVPRSVLGDRPHLLLGDTTYDRRRNLYVLREIAVLDDGTVAMQQTSAWLCPFDRIPALFQGAGLTVERLFDGWTAGSASQLSDSVLVIARR